ncbi:MAG TPA: hypothetical protein PK089_07625 [Methanoregulaceae archaeon]|nr:hypothetical protein [Methanoregulaceae archaeon]HQJ87520.1 hypothetical protein [Methanoregulaceae archaeon]
MSALGERLADGTVPMVGSNDCLHGGGFMNGLSLTTLSYGGVVFEYGAFNGREARVGSRGGGVRTPSAGRQDNMPGGHS